jgi:hypothetical protein
MVDRTPRIDTQYKLEIKPFFNLPLYLHPLLTLVRPLSCYPPTWHGLHTCMLRAIPIIEQAAVPNAACKSTNYTRLAGVYIRGIEAARYKPRDRRKKAMCGTLPWLMKWLSHLQEGGRELCGSGELVSFGKPRRHHPLEPGGCVNAAHSMLDFD